MFDIDISHLLYLVSVWALPTIVAITLHEAAHGFAAWKLGDDTAYRLGRVTFNPLRHVDPVGTLLLPAMMLILSGGRFMFGYAKAVPVDFYRLRRPRRDIVLVAAAGPGVNIALALVSALLLHVAPIVPDMAARWAAENLVNSIFINLILAVFNLIPLPPLDGGRMAVGLLPYRLAAPLAKLERWGLLIIIMLLFILPMIGNQIGVDLNFLSSFVMAIVHQATLAIAKLMGLM
jgi:Zn-dependent protease